MGPMVPVVDQQDMGPLGWLHNDPLEVDTAPWPDGPP